MLHVYTARVRVRHHEVDAFGRITPATHLRILAQTAIDASAAAGFDGAWYAAAGGHWLVRRSTFGVHRHVRGGADLEVDTWVEDFRRVLSARRYEVRTAAGAPVLGAVTDWVYVDSTTGRIRRIPEAMQQGFGASTASPAARPPFRLPPQPREPARSRCRVRWADLDALAHVNNAAYLDMLVESVLEVLAERDWPVPRLAGGGAPPSVMGGDVEYLDAALFGDELETTTWFTASAGGIEAHQRLVRASDGRPMVQATTSWRWLAQGNEPVPPPPGLVDALRPLVAA